MFRLMVVEDEDFIREAIVSSIDWADIGFEIEQAEDGEVALKKADLFRPDAVVTDVRMPIMDGLELAASLRERYPDTVVVVLSGHDEFKYAQEAMSLGVTEYITKPIRPRDFRLAMRRLHEKLTKLHSEREAVDKLQSQLYQSLPLLRERFFNRLVTRHMRRDTIDERLSFLELEVSGLEFTVLLFSAHQTSGDSVKWGELIRFALTNVVSEEMGDRGHCFNDAAGRVVVIFCARDPESEGRDFLAEMAESLRLSNQYVLDFIITAAIGATVESLAELPFSYETAVAAMEQQILLGRGRTYDYSDFSCIGQEDFNFFSQVEELITGFHFKSRDEFLRQLKELTSSMTGPSDLKRPDSVRVALIDLLNGVHRVLIESGCALPADGNDMYGRILSMDMLEDLIPLLESYLCEAKSSLAGVNSSRGAKLIKLACKYIRKNYHDPSLSLNLVAEHIYISPVYLSMLFKRELSVTFVDYVLATRMERAKLFLEEGTAKNYEIASMVGYNDPQYFSNCFKKHTGMTPSEYRAKRR